MTTCIPIDFTVSIEHPGILCWTSPHLSTRFIFTTPSYDYINNQSGILIRIVSPESLKHTVFATNLPYFKDKDFWMNIDLSTISEPDLFITPQFQSYYNYMTERGLRQVLAEYSKYINK